MKTNIILQLVVAIIHILYKKKWSELKFMLEDILLKKLVKIKPKSLISLTLI
jgi:hypothetical protein